MHCPTWAGIQFFAQMIKNKRYQLHFCDIAAVSVPTFIFLTVSDGRGRQEVCQEEAWEPEPSSGPGNRPLLPFRYVRPAGHVQEEDKDH